MVKIYDSTRAMRQSLNAPTATAESFGAGIGRALQQVGQGLSSVANMGFDIAKEKKEEYDTLKVSDVDRNLSVTSMDLMNKDIFLREGEKALGASKEFEEAFDKKVNELSEILENASQKRLFFKLAQKRRENYLNVINSFEREQFQKYKQDNMQASVDNAIEEALANYTNDDIVQMSFNKGLAAIRANYVGQGEIGVQKERQYKASFYKPMISKLSLKDSEKARNYYMAHKNDIAASEHEAIERMIYDDTVKQRAVKNADTLWMNGKSEREQLDEAYKIQDAEERDLTINRIKSRWSDKRRMDDIEKKERQEKQWEQFTQSQSAEEALDILSAVSEPNFRKTLENEYGYRWLGMAKPNSYQYQKGLTLQANNTKLTADIDTAIQDGFIPDSLINTIEGIQDEQTKKAYQNYVSKGGIIETDSKTYVMLDSLAQRNPSNFAGIDLNHYIDQLSVADRTHLQAVQDDIQCNQMNEIGSGEYTEFLSRHDHVNRYMRLLGIDEKEKPEEYYKAIVRLESAVNEYESTQLQGKRKASTQEIDTIVTRMAGSFSQEGWEFYKDVKLPQLAGQPVEKRAKVYQPFNKISIGDLSDIKAYLFTQGISGNPATDNQLKKLYQKMYPAILGRDRETMDYLINQYKDVKK